MMEKKYGGGGWIHTIIVPLIRYSSILIRSNSLTFVHPDENLLQFIAYRNILSVIHIDKENNRILL